MTSRPTPALMAATLIALALIPAPARQAVADTVHAASPQVIWSYDTEG